MATNKALAKRAAGMLVFAAGICAGTAAWGDAWTESVEVDGIWYGINGNDFTARVDHGSEGITHADIPSDVPYSYPKSRLTRPR